MLIWSRDTSHIISTDTHKALQGYFSFYLEAPPDMEDDFVD
jgi:hypothetical protein